MRRIDELANPSSCLNRARDNEFVFTLLERDVATPGTIRFWISERIRLGKNQPGDPQLVAAELDAQAIEEAQAKSPTHA